jgi:hypothetical protein
MEAEGTGAETVAEGRRILAPIHFTVHRNYFCKRDRKETDNSNER